MKQNEQQDVFLIIYPYEVQQEDPGQKEEDYQAPKAITDGQKPQSQEIMDDVQEPQLRTRDWFQSKEAPVPFVFWYISTMV